jgi:pyrroline-5-carboxylate reductase
MAIRNVKRLGEFRGALVLVGAGKMGSAMLEGWLARGLDPKKINGEGAGATGTQA